VLPQARRRLGGALGYLAEFFRLPGWYSADEVLRLHQRLVSSAGGERECGELLELVGLADARRVRVDAMSKGMQQRLGIAQALVGSPPALLLDEPTSALDPAGRRTVRVLLEELRRREIGVLLNSHLLSEVELVCARATSPSCWARRSSRSRARISSALTAARAHEPPGLDRALALHVDEP
jgi:ABC-2 type transport system ATP-binding protein